MRGNASELLAALLELAAELELDVRRLRTAPEAPQSSAVCRLRDRVCVFLAAGDPPESQLLTLADAIRLHAGKSIENRYLAPDLRAVLESGSDPRKPINLA